MISVLPALAAAVVDWIAVARASKPLEYIVKPTTIALLLVGAYASGIEVPPALAVALLCSLAGDIFLMLPEDRFLPGLVAFLGAHVAYIVLFLPWADLSAAWGIVAVAVVVAGVLVGSRIVRGLRSGEARSLIAPVLGYMVVISAMVLAAAATESSWIVAGATLFYVSDSLIGWNRFVRASAWGPVAIIVTYHLGQIALTVGALTFAG